MNASSGLRAVFLASCPDQKGLVARFAQFIFKANGNIVDADQHTDHQAGLFCTRLEWEMDGFAIPRHALHDKLGRLMQDIGGQWSLRFSDARPKLAVWVSRQDHCLIDLLSRQRTGDLRGDIALVLSNHQDLGAIAEQFRIPFYHFPVSSMSKAEVEAKELELMAREGIDLIILAKYMQVLSADFLKKSPQVINIHHSFLPAFAGAQPYHRAFERGVKIIGATAHYVTEDLDEGPIIEQDVARVSHRSSVQDMIRRGKDLEKVVLARAVYYHVEGRVLVYGNKTVVFE